MVSLISQNLSVQENLQFLKLFQQLRMGLTLKLFDFTPSGVKKCPRYVKVHEQFQDALKNLYYILLLGLWAIKQHTLNTYFLFKSTLI